MALAPDYKEKYPAHIIAALREPDVEDAWCSRCPESATATRTVTDGSSTYRASYCPGHLWLLIAPRGPEKRPHDPGGPLCG